jgi:hypothetical protein
VVGTSTPPSGLSGAIRRVAFRRSESDWWHWLMLMGADRINVLEGVIQDLGRGIIPNVPAEMGARAEWQHNKSGLAKKVGVVLALSTAIYAVKRTRGGKSLEASQPEGPLAGLETMPQDQVIALPAPADGKSSDASPYE